jgi:Kef-type K+ transport system membrane component KefB
MLTSLGASHSTVVRPLSWLTLATVLVWPVQAWASSMTDEAFNSILLLLSAVGAGYVLTHVAIERLSRRTIVVADVQYVVLGIVLGPVLGIIDTELTRDVGPVLALGAGALGMLAGLELRSVPTRGMRRWGPAVAIVTSTAVFVIGIPLAAASLLGYDVVGDSAWTGALIAAGMVALSTTDDTVRSIAAFLRSSRASGTRSSDARGGWTRSWRPGPH